LVLAVAASSAAHERQRRLPIVVRTGGALSSRCSMSCGLRTQQIDKVFGIGDERQERDCIFHGSRPA